MRSPYERRRVNLTERPGLSPKMAGAIWWVLTILLLASTIAFSYAWLSQNSAPVQVVCRTEKGEACQ